jgi:hypothetical protein
MYDACSIISFTVNDELDQVFPQQVFFGLLLGKGGRFGHRPVPGGDFRFSVVLVFANDSVPASG